MEQELSNLQKLIDTVIEFFVNYSFQVIGAIIVLLVGMVIANWVAGLLMAVFEKKKFDITLAKFAAATVKIIILAFAVIVALGKFGITIAPFIAALGAIAFGASFALQGPLANYGAGISIIMTRPFIVGNTITVADVSGVVQEVKLACTILQDEDGVRITIPNKKIVGEIIHNSKENKVYDGVVGVSYDANIESAIQVVTDVIKKYSDVCQTPMPQIGVKEFGDSSVNIAYRIWVPTIKYFKITHAVNLDIFKALQQAEISIPFPQRDLHIVSQTTAGSAQI